MGEALRNRDFLKFNHIKTGGGCGDSDMDRSLLLS